MARKSRAPKPVPFAIRVRRFCLRVATLSAFTIVAGIAGVFALLLMTYDAYATKFVDPRALEINEPSRGAVILDRNGNELYRFVDDESGLRKPVALQDVAVDMLAATIATEDGSFFENPGVNFRGLTRATLQGLDSFVNQGDLSTGTGGSSITQQLIKNVYVAPEDRGDRSIDRKLTEIVYAAELTKEESKEQILQWYMNEVSFGGIYSGIEAAAQGYYGKSAHDLTLGEASLLAGVPQAPGQLELRSNLEAAMQRRNRVLDLMLQRGTIDVGFGRTYAVDPAAVEAARVEQPRLRNEQFPIRAPHFVLTYALPQLEKLFGKEALMRDGLTITTSIDVDLNDRAQVILERSIRDFESVSNTHNGAVEVLDPRSGEILVMVGSRDYWRDDIAGAINNLTAANSPGSTFKPFVYLTGFITKGWSPGTILQDSPISYREIDGTYFSPTNPGGGAYHGPISIRDALGNSLNVPAFAAALQIGVPDILKTARSVGLTSLADSYGPAISLGGVDFKAFDMTYAYSVLANSGAMNGQDTFTPTEADERMVNPIGILKVVDSDGNARFDVETHRVSRQVVPADKANLVTSILSDGGARCITFGCGGLAVPGYHVAVKTGTSEPFDPSGPNRGKIGETWAFGYTPDLVVGIWAGNSNNAPISNIYSTSISFRAMRDVMLEVYAGRPQTPFRLQ